VLACCRPRPHNFPSVLSVPIPAAFSDVGFALLRLTVQVPLWPLVSFPSPFQLRF
jgi:hypothetical protein